MPRLAANQVPALREHKASGRAVVTLDQRDYYCGAWGSPQAQQEYTRLVQVWWANGRKMPRQAETITVGDLADRYLTEYARAHRKRGRETTAVGTVRNLVAEIKSLYEGLPVGQFGQDELRTLRSGWVDPVPGSQFRARAVVRTTANAYQYKVVGMFRWGLRRKLVPVEVVVELEAVGGLSVGEDGVEEPEAVRAVPDAIVDKTIEHLRPKWLHDVVRLQRLTGMRPMEALAIRPCDLDRSGEVWVYEVSKDWFKSAHKRKSRHVAIGPRGQALLQPHLDRAPGPEWYIFRGTRSKTLNRPYRENSYRNRVYEACDRAKIARWSPNALRHAGLTETRAKAGLDTAQSLAGHASASMTERYAPALPSKAIEWARENG